MAQVVEHVLGKDEVTGSSPVSSSKPQGLKVLGAYFLGVRGEILLYLFLNKKLFACWCGLIVSGYDLYDNSDNEIIYLCDKIKQELYGNEIANFFAFAKTEKIECNPYFPRASNLSVYCFFESVTVDEYYSFLELCGDDEHKKHEFKEWIKLCDKYINLIITNPLFENLFLEYNQIVKSKFGITDSIVNSIKNELHKYDLCSEIKLCVAPNLLQSPFLTDYVYIDNNLYIICAKFSVESIVHEYLHIFAKNYKDIFKNKILESKISVDINCEEMIKKGYMSDFTNKSKTHAEEELLVRELTKLICRNIRELYQY